MCDNKMTSPIGQGTTPAFTFNLPPGFLFQSITALCVAFSQRGRVVVEKSLEDAVETGAEQFSVTLSQEDTLSLRSGEYVSFQVRFTDQLGNASSSDIYMAMVEEALCEEVLG